MLYRTTYGDMRSFISVDSSLGSYGLDDVLVDEFNCFGDTLLESGDTTTIELFPTGDDDFTLIEVKTFNARGLILRNLDTGDDIGFGVMSQLNRPVEFENTAKDICALCQDHERLSLVLESELNQSAHTLYSFYMPLEYDLLKNVNNTGVNLIIDGFDPVIVDENQLSTTIDRCAKFSVVLQDHKTEPNAWTYFAYGQTVSAFLTKTTTVENTDGTTSENLSQVYEDNPVKCTFGYANPGFSLSWSNYCAQAEVSV